MPTIEQLTRALKASPGDAFLLYGLALEYAKTGQYEDALEHFDHAIQADPTNAYHFYHKARTLEAMGNLADAIHTLHQGMTAAQADPHPKAQSELGNYLEDLEAQRHTKDHTLP